MSMIKIVKIMVTIETGSIVFIKEELFIFALVF